MPTVDMNQAQIVPGVSIDIDEADADMFLNFLSKTSGG